MFYQDINREVQKEMLESINKMIDFNEYGLSGFKYDFADTCGNSAIFPEFFEGYNGVLVEKSFFCCPWQKSILFGTENEFPEENKDCELNCLKDVFSKNSELRKEILERFKSLLESGYYLDCYENNKPIKPLLSKIERAIIESYEEKSISAFEKEQKLQTEKNYLSNMLYFRGTKQEPVDKELFEFWSKFMTEKNKTVVEIFKRTANTSIVLNIHWDLVDDEYEKDEDGEYYYNHIMSCPQVIQSPIYRNDCFIQMSLFDCVELNQTLFHFGFNSNNIILPATKDLEEFYMKWKNKKLSK